MSEENIEINITQNPGNLPEQNNNENSLMPGFKSVCTKLGLMMITIFVCRLFVMFVPVLVFGDFFYSLDEMGQTIANLVLNIIFLYLLPITLTAVILKFPISSNAGSLYQKPRYMGKALGMFPAAYSAAILIRLLTMALGALLSNTIFKNSFNATGDTLTASSLPEALILFVQLAVIAPLFEEFWFRGMVLHSLQPYGNGFAIFISAILFGITHSNFEQFFYAAALGIVLGYIAVQTNSLIPSTIMHFFFNSISGVLVLLSSDTSVQDYVLAGQRGEEGVITPAVGFYIAWIALIMLLMLVGLIMAIIKFTKIKKFRVPKVQTELSSKTRWRIFFTRISVIISLILAIFSFVPDLLSWLLS